MSTASETASVLDVFENTLRVLGWSARLMDHLPPGASVALTMQFGSGRSAYDQDWLLVKGSWVRVDSVRLDGRKTVAPTLLAQWLDRRALELT